jgi:hypothetical protein
MSAMSPARSELAPQQIQRLRQVADLQPVKFDALAPLHKGAHIGQRERARDRGAVGEELLQRFGSG